MNHKPSLWNTGHWPTLVSAFLYFDFSFMVWTVLGPLSAHIKEALHLSDQQTGLMVAVPSLGGAGLRIALGLLVDRIGAKNTGLLAQCIVMGALAWGWLLGLGSFQAVILMGFMLGFGKAFAYQCAGEVFDEIRQTWNAKTGYDLRGISYASLRQNPRQWPCAPTAGHGEPIRFLTPNKSIHFPTASGKGNFLARPFLPPAELPDQDFPFALNTGRLAHQWHTLTKTGKVPALNKLNPGPFVEIHPDDARSLGVVAGALVKVASRRGFAIRFRIPSAAPFTQTQRIYINETLRKMLVSR